MKRTRTIASEEDAIRAQSEVLGWTILLGLTMAAIGMILFVGQPILQDTQEDVRVQNIVNSFGLIDERVSAVSLSGSKRKTMRLNLDEGELVFEERAGGMNITVYDKETGDYEGKIYQTDRLGRVEYQAGNQRLAYQAGGIWHKEEGGNLSTFRSVPEIQYQGSTVTASIVNITNNFTTTGGGRTLVISDNGSQRIHPSVGHPDPTKRNPLENRLVRIVVQTEYYDAWAQYFDIKTVGNSVCYKNTTGSKALQYGGQNECQISDWPVPVHDIPQESVMMLLEPSPSAPFQNAVLSTGGAVQVLGDSLVDSYNSELGEYSNDTRLENADLIANDTVEIGSPGAGPKPEWYGNLKSEENVVVTDDSQVNGTIAANGPSGPPAGGTAIEINSVGCPIRESQDQLVADTDTYNIVYGGCSSSVKKNSNPNVDADLGTEQVNATREVRRRIQAAEDDGWGSLPTDTDMDGVVNVTPGNYYVQSDFEYFDKNVNFETENGKITIAITNQTLGGNVNFGFDDSKINVTGENGVEVYRGYANSNNAYRFTDTTMTIAENDTSLFISFVTFTSQTGSGPNLEMRNSTYRGPILAPNNFRIRILDDSEMFGSVVASKTEIQDSDVHYDESLATLELGNPEERDLLSYLYVTENRVDIR